MKVMPTAYLKILVLLDHTNQSEITVYSARYGSSSDSPSSIMFHLKRKKSFKQISVYDAFQVPGAICLHPDRKTEAGKDCGLVRI